MNIWIQELCWIGHKNCAGLDTNIVLQVLCLRRLYWIAHKDCLASAMLDWTQRLCSSIGDKDCAGVLVKCYLMATKIGHKDCLASAMLDVLCSIGHKIVLVQYLDSKAMLDWPQRLFGKCYQ